MTGDASDYVDDLGHIIHHLPLSSLPSLPLQSGMEVMGDSWDELKCIRQAVTFLVLGNKQRKSLEDITRDLCPVLSIQQLYRISTM
jgi:myosin-5